ncbi:hypothetical protein NDA01_16135 [Trichocoleus desertorum AS-A10]|uniref:hypothetical protein n=1 Tax=Trichocoleus desertorum TaxID=1481672 RepID=UPI00329A39EC
MMRVRSIACYLSPRWLNPSLDAHCITERSQPLQYELPKMGNYYVFGYGGPGNHFYDFKVRVD